MSLSLARPAAFLHSRGAAAFRYAPAVPRRGRAPAATPAADRKRLGIAAIVGGTICFPMSDIMAQSLMGALPPLEVAWLRYCVFFLAALPLLMGGGAVLRSARPGLQVLRGSMTCAATVAALIAFKYLPVPDTTAIGFVCPVFVTALAAVVLKEAVGLRRWLAALAALGGVLIIVQPGAASFQPIALLPLFGAGAAALGVICTRLNRDDDARTTILYTTGVGTLLLTGAASFDLVMPTPAEFGVILVVGLFGALGSVLQVVGYRMAPASLLAPFTYLQLIAASGLSFVLLGTVPHVSMAVGAAVIAGSAVYTAWRERVRVVAA